MASFFAQCCSSNLQPLLAPEWLSMQTCGAFPRPLLESSSETNLAEAHGQHRQSTLDSRLLEFPAGLGDVPFFIFFPVRPFINKTLACTLIVPKADSSESWSWLALCLSRAGGRTRGNSCSIHFSFVACWKMLEDVLSTHINPNFFETTASSDASVRRSMIFSNSWLQRSKATSAASVPPSLQKNGLKRNGARYECKQCYPKYVKMRDQRHAAIDKFFMVICLGILYGHICMYMCMYANT